MVGNLEIPPLPPLFSLPVEIPPATQATESEEFIFIEPISLSSAEPYEFLVKLRNITWETNYVIVSQNALGMMGRRKLRFVNHRSHPPPSRTTKCPLLSLHYPYKSYIIQTLRRRVNQSRSQSMPVRGLYEFFA